MTSSLTGFFEAYAIFRARSQNAKNARFNGTLPIRDLQYCFEYKIRYIRITRFTKLFIPVNPKAKIVS